MITPEARAKAAQARAEMVTKRTTFKGCDGTALKVGDRVKAKAPRYKTAGTVVALHREPPYGYMEVGVHFGAVRPEHLTATEAHAWFRDDELEKLLLRPSVNA